ncbi:MAG: VOC family protein [Dehalococcoidia bacterium]|nr:VOC family protein [Dehalococcoidia bacterium]
MKIKLVSVHVDDQEKALQFYTDVLGFTKKTDVSAGDYRWLTVVSPEEPDGAELVLEPNDNPAARSYQQALFEQSIPAVVFYTSDLQRDHDRLAGKGVTFTVPPTTEARGAMAILDDTCGNLVQLTQLPGEG